MASTATPATLVFCPMASPIPRSLSSAGNCAVIHRLPADLVAALREATYRAEYDQMLAWVDQISSRDEQLGQRLRELMTKFAFGTLLRYWAPRGWERESAGYRARLPTKTPQAASAAVAGGFSHTATRSSHGPSTSRGGPGPLAPGQRRRRTPPLPCGR